MHALVKTPEMNEQGKRSRIENPASIQPTPENPKVFFYSFFMFFIYYFSIVVSIVYFNLTLLFL